MLTARVDNAAKTAHDGIEFNSYTLLRSHEGRQATLKYRVGDETKERVIHGGEVIYIMNGEGRTIDIFRSKR